MKRFILSIAVLLVASSLSAKVTLPPVIGDNMVLQQNTSAAIFGKAEPGKTVTVKTSWNKKKVSTVADSQTGKWLVRVQTPAAGGPYEITISDGEKLVLHDVLIGEVWWASGQSNMEMPMKGYGSQPAKDGTKYIASAKASRPIRICNIERRSSISVQDSCAGAWGKNTPNVVANTSATAYFFADALQNVLDIPVGIIVTSWGGSSIETWIKREVIEKDFPEFKLGYLDGKGEVPKKKIHQWPCLLYNGQVAPLVPYTFKGMIWYQGEANRARPEQYLRLQKAYVEMMRSEFQVPDAPFYCVQIAPYPYDNGRKTHSGYLCEAQQKSVQQLKHAGYVTTTDIGEYGTIHPCRKQEVGQRLAWLALQNDYGCDAIEATAPYYKSVEFKEGAAFVTMVVDKLGLSPMGAEIPGFEIAGADHRFYPAKAWRMHKAEIKVWSDKVPEPVAVRYCWRNWCVGGLYNNFGIPAGPFRTDDWPVDEADWTVDVQ